jgi:catechol 2,3-dioxygenase-like lactoylglutathione lyase family enzyme
MAGPHAHLSLVTLGVSDVARAAAFYEKLGFKRRMPKAEGVAFFDAGPVVLSLYGSEGLAGDADIATEPAAGFRATAMAWNCPDAGTVDAVLDLAVKSGGTLVKAGYRIFWGGYVGFFKDPDGHLWEVAHNPQFPLSADGKLTLPD